MTQPPCPLAEGDRVDHRKFGLGTVVAIDGPPSVGAPRGPGSPPPNAWKVTVACDDPARGAIRVLSTFLTKVASPDARPFVYWDRQWRPLRDRWLQARDAVEKALETFRPLPDPDVLARLRAAEQEALESLERFLAEERAGAHGPI